MREYIFRDISFSVCKSHGDSGYEVYSTALCWDVPFPDIAKICAIPNGYRIALPLLGYTEDVYSRFVDALDAACSGLQGIEFHRIQATDSFESLPMASED